MHAILYGPDDVAALAERVPPRPANANVVAHAAHQAQLAYTEAILDGMTIDEGYTLAFAWARQVVSTN